jgi:hypothetical protein
VGYLVHVLGQWIAVGLMIYFWRAMLHLLGYLEAFAIGWQRSHSQYFGFIDGFINMFGHLISEPIYCLQLLLIFLVLYLTVNRQGYGDPVYVPFKPNHGGFLLFSSLTLFKK